MWSLHPSHCIDSCVKGQCISGVQTTVVYNFAQLLVQQGTKKKDCMPGIFIISVCTICGKMSNNQSYNYLTVGHSGVRKTLLSWQILFHTDLLPASPGGTQCSEKYALHMTHAQRGFTIKQAHHKRRAYSQNMRMTLVCICETTFFRVNINLLL